MSIYQKLDETQHVKNNIFYYLPNFFTVSVLKVNINSTDKVVPFEVHFRYISCIDNMFIWIA